MSGAQFTQLAAQAAARGQSLERTTNGYLLRRGDHSVHAQDLEAVAALLDAGTPAEKVEATVVARLALAGFVVHRVESGYVACEQSRARHFQSLHALTNFARGLEGQP